MEPEISTTKMYSRGTMLPGLTGRRRHHGQEEVFLGATGEQHAALEHLAAQAVVEDEVAVVARLLPVLQGHPGVPGRDRLPEDAMGARGDLADGGGRLQVDLHGEGVATGVASARCGVELHASALWLSCPGAPL